MTTILPDFLVVHQVLAQVALFGQAKVEADRFTADHIQEMFEGCNMVVEVDGPYHRYEDRHVCDVVVKPRPCS